MAEQIRDAEAYSTEVNRDLDEALAVIGLIADVINLKAIGVDVPDWIVRRIATKEVMA